MDKTEIVSIAKKLFHECPGNVVMPEQAISPDLSGLVIYDEPLVGFARASDSLFAEYKNTNAIGPWYMLPNEWLPEAASVISLFFPFTERVRKSNITSELDHPSLEWIHGRVEGQAFISAFMKELRSWFTSKDVACCVPLLDKRFKSSLAGKGLKTYPEANANTYGSNWSERHAAYACGLGTFGLSKGIITERGMAGRFGSIIVGVDLPPSERPYTGRYDYCIQCGACARRCPVHAINPEDGPDFAKKHSLCSQWLDETKKIYAPRYGCGKCQTGVPCESRNPASSAKV